MQPEESFSVLLRRHRVAAALSQEALADRAGLSVRAVSDLERGVKTRPHLETVRLLADALGLDDQARAMLAASTRPAADSIHPAPPLMAGGQPLLATLPPIPTPLIGREHEIQVVGNLLCDPNVRLVTLSGPGGVGKTHLAMVVAAEVAKDFTDGVVWVDLAPVSGADLVLPTITRALGARDASSRPPLEHLAGTLHGRKILLVLDNFEHVLAAAAQVSAILALTGATVLVTSRIVLNVSTEHVVTVQPLPLPDAGATAPAAIAGNDAVRLLVTRARASRSDFELTDSSAVDVAEICRLLDGLPLALELAAARTAHLPLPALRDRLSKRLPMLTGGPRDLPARQQTMRNTIAWSHDLLTESEQRLFRRVAVFTGGFTLEAVEAIGWEADVGSSPAASRFPTSDFVLDTVASLVDNSLIRLESGVTREPRYQMLETVREFAAERLVESGEASFVGRRHAEFYLAFAERDVSQVFFRAEPVWLDRIAAEHGNIRAALDWFTANGDADACVQLAGASAAFWYARGHVHEARSYLIQALAMEHGRDPTAARGRALSWAGQFAVTAGEPALATPLWKEAVAVWNAVGDLRGRASALHMAAMAEEHQLHFDESAALYEEGLAAWREIGDAIGLATSLALLGGVEYGRGDFTKAFAFEEEAATLFYQLGEGRLGALSAWYLGIFSADTGQIPAAARYHRESLLGLLAAGDAVWLFKPVVGLADIAATVAEPTTAAELLGVVDGLLNRSGAQLLPFDRAPYERAAASARAALGDAAFDTAHRAGLGLPPDELPAIVDAVLRLVEQPGTAASD